MSRQMLRLGFAALLGAATMCWGQVQAPTNGAPKDATGVCKDGTYTTSPKKSGACSGHKGVKTWYNTVGGPVDPDIKSSRTSPSNNTKNTAKSDSTVNPHSDSNVSSGRADAINKKSGDAAVATPNDNGKTVPGPAANGSAGNSASGPSGSNSGKGSSSSVAGRTAAPGGGPDLVWVNTTSNTYHCYGTAYYGKTKNGKYMSEQDAKNAGAKPDHGKACSAR